MEPRKAQKTLELREEKKRRFRIERLEERIAPRGNPHTPDPCSSGPSRPGITEGGCYN